MPQGWGTGWGGEKWSGEISWDFLGFLWDFVGFLWDFLRDFVGIPLKNKPYQYGISCLTLS